MMQTKKRMHQQSINIEHIPQLHMFDDIETDEVQMDK